MIELLALVANAVLWVVPLWRILPRAGMNRNLAWLGVVPLLGTAMLWVLALRRWPAERA